MREYQRGKLVVTRAAAKVLRDPRVIPAKAATALLDDLTRIAADPYGDHPQAKPLRGGPGLFRVRHGDWRAAYELDPASETMRVLWVKHRKDAYE